MTITNLINNLNSVPELLTLAMKENLISLDLTL